MKCLICGSVNSPSRQSCSECNTPLPRSQKRQDSQPENNSQQTSIPVPEWRREVSAKVRAYGERKKRLTTPPHSWKEAGQQEVAVSAGLQENPEAEPRELPVPKRRKPPATAPSPTAAPAQPAASAPTSGNAVAPHSHSLEVWNEDLESEDQAGEEEATPSLFLPRRALALAVDSTIIVIMSCGLIALLSWMIGQSFGSFLLTGWSIWVPVSLLFHFVYYLYFYKASRQTPGLLFVSLEVRDPSSSELSGLKILVRWAAMVGLNVLNLLPAITGRRSLLLDDLSGTFVRSLK